jgi:hypothetical protein
VSPVSSKSTANDERASTSVTTSSGGGKSDRVSSSKTSSSVQTAEEASDAVPDIIEASSIATARMLTNFVVRRYLNL